MANFQIIRELCISRGLSLKDLAKKSGITEVTLYNIINNNQGRSSNIEAIAHTLNVPIGLLFGEDTKENYSVSGELTDYLEGHIDRLKKELQEKDDLIKKLLSRIDQNNQK